MKQFYFLVAALFGVFVLNFFIFLPFFQIIFMALAISIVCSPLYSRVLKTFKDKEGISAFFTTLIIVLAILGPLFALSTQVFRESVDLYEYFTMEGKQQMIDIASDVFDKVYGAVPYAKELSLDVDQYVESSLSWIIQRSGSVFSSLSLLVFDMFLFFVALFYMFKDGNKINSFMVSLNVLDDDVYHKVKTSIVLSIKSIIGGTLIIALIQGLLVSVGLFMFGVPNVVLWGILAVFAALIPGLGTSLVTIPAVIYLFIFGNPPFAVGMLLWGMLLVGLIDNFLGPKFVGKKTNIHPAIVLFSVLGGVSFFGPLGFILGPLSVSFLLVLFEVYMSKRV